MPPKKRTADAVELPASERARRVMMELAASLTEVVALFTPIEAGLAPPVPLAASLVDTTMQLLASANAVVKAEHIAPIEQKWLPDEMFQRVFEFVTGRREASQFGAGGALMEGSISFYSKRWRPFMTLPTLRLVCKSWARIAGSLAFVLNVPLRRAFNPVEIATSFSNAIILRHFENTPTKPHMVRLSALLQLLMTDRVQPLYVKMSSWRFVAPFSLHGAYLTGDQRHNDDSNFDAKYSFSVMPIASDNMNPCGDVSMCTPKRIADALTSRMPVKFHLCNSYTPCSPDLKLLDKSTKFNVPSVGLDLQSYPRHRKQPLTKFWMDILSNPDYWEHGTLPSITFTGDTVYIDEFSFSFATDFYNFVMAVGVDRVKFNICRRMEISEWVDNYRAFAAHQ